MKNIYDLSNTLFAKFEGWSLIYISLVLGLFVLADHTIGQKADVASGRSHQMEQDERFWVGFLRNKEQQKAFPGAMSEAFEKLGMIARLRGISSSETISVLAEYLDMTKQSLEGSSNESSSSGEFVFEPHLKVPEERFPAVVVFQHIGKPALPFLLSVIGSTEVGSTKYRNAVFLVKYNFREDWSKASDYIRRSAESMPENNKKVKENLLDAANEILRDFHRVNSNP
jgi:hypothetical protein